MNSSLQQCLQIKNSFNVKAFSEKILKPNSIEALQEIADMTEVIEQHFYILGDGSNTLFVDEQAPTIIQPKFSGIEITEHNDHYSVQVGASENWHDLVSLCIEQGINGLENLALIPGSVGAAPVQNIGAYGVEFANFCREVNFFEFASKKLITLSNHDCQFAYRDSIFKGRLYNKGIITQVTLDLPKDWQRKTSYHGLNTLPDTASAKTIMNAVISLRQSKLPEPNKLPNAGSFFKNPVVSKEMFEQLQSKYPSIPSYPQENGDIKLAAGWLIEQSGLKGGMYKDVGIHKNQALVLVNYGQGTGKDVLSLAKYIQQHIKAVFNIEITPEVRMISAQGEQPFASFTHFTPISELTYD